MTGPHHDTPHRRLSDQGRCGRLRATVLAWWWSWGQILFGVLVLCAAIGVFIVALQVRDISVEKARDDAATAKAARQACERARTLGPPLVEDYKVRRVLTADQLALYQSLIPKTCPKK